MKRRVVAVWLTVFLLVSAASAQKAEVTIGLNEAFFEALLDSVFQNFGPPEFSMAHGPMNRRDRERPAVMSAPKGSTHSFAASGDRIVNEPAICDESVTILREMRGVRTAVRFRDGKIFVPLAFTGKYSAPLIGCLDVAGTAESNINLEFDQAAQKLIGRIRVNKVNLNGTGGIGGTIVARLIQGTIDKELNPIEILSLDKVSFGFPVQGSGNLQMKAIRIRPEIGVGLLNVRVDYEFLKG